MKNRYRRLIPALVLACLMALPLPALAGGEKDPFQAYDRSRGRRLAGLADPSGEKRRMSLEGGEEEDEAGAYLVRFKDESSKADILRVLEGEDYRLIGPSDRRLVRLVSPDPAPFIARADDLVACLEEDREKEIFRSVNDAYADQQWALDCLNIFEAWDISTGSADLAIGVLDTGVNRDHLDLLRADIRAGWDYLEKTSVTGDPEGHGTQVTGLIAATANNRLGIAGICWQGAIIPFRVLGADGTGYTSHTIEALYDAVDSGCQVINISYGSNRADRLEEEAIQYALDRGVIVIAAAGNDYSTDNNYPASYPGVISAASINRELQVSEFSNRNKAVSFCAPGEAIWTTEGRISYRQASGTSFAAPHLTAIAGLAKAIRPDLTSRDFILAAKRTAKDLGAVGPDPAYGHGLPDAGALLQAVKGHFKDFGYRHWAYAYVMRLVDEGTIRGYPDRTFRPDLPVRRDHATKMIALSAGLTPQDLNPVFPDYGPEEEMAPYLAALMATGAIRGYPDGTFRPQKHILREHLCQIITLAFDLEMGDLPSDFQDLSGHQEADHYIRILASNGIVKGRSESLFKPKDEVTRAELSKILRLAATVKALQGAEKRQTEKSLDEAWALILDLPADQDLDTRSYLVRRLNRIGTR